jgi:hypothetical protein
MAGIDYTKTKGQDVWMWELYKNYGYVTFSARDFCSRLPLPTLCILTLSHSLAHPHIHLSRASEWMYDDFISRPWTDSHFQEMYCEMLYKQHGSAYPHCLGQRHAHEFIIRAANLFKKLHAEVPTFTLLDFTEGHEPSMTVIRSTSAPFSFPSSSSLHFLGRKQSQFFSVGRWMIIWKKCSRRRWQGETQLSY